MSSKQGDKRSVSTDALETLGTVPIDGAQKRDAIHLAVEPVVAGENLGPGDHINVVEGVAFEVEQGKGLGIVDPFVPRLIKKGERFWFVMYPRQVHSLRHVWTHPAFADEPFVAPVVADEESAERKEASERWLREFIAGSDISQWSYEDVLKVALGGKVGEEGDDAYNYLAHQGDYIHSGGSDASGEIPGEFWFHVEVVTGVKIDPSQRATYFSCSC